MGRTGALKHDLLDLAVLELTARTSLIPWVIPFGHKLVKKSERVDDFQTYTKNYEISGLTPPSMTLLVPTPKPKHSQIAGRKSRRSARRSRLILIGGRRPMERFVLIRQQIWRCFM